MMKRQTRWLSWIVVVFLVLSMPDGRAVSLKAEENAVLINNAEDLILLAKDCTLDSWSWGKEVKLMADIDVSGREFAGIPTFGGTFDGNGHSITGLNIRRSGSVQGFFRYIQTGGLVKNLTVKGNVVPGGTKAQLGGIAGKNSGTIKECTFAGTIEGESDLGGIAGVNEAAGQIIDCTAMGQAAGSHYVGGIAGENLGTILKSRNKMDVNTSASDQEVTLEDLENINLKKLNDTENTTAITDVGGIAGFSTGIIQGCENFGAVGYQHIGYNIGGIAGRQSGYLNACINQGEIYGRKDVGGIVGQLEPHITLEFSEDQMARLRNELDGLKKILNQAINDADSTSSEISGRLDETKVYVDQALDSTHSIMDEAEKLYNDGVDSINNLSARVTDTLEKLVPVLERAKSVGEEAVLAMEQLREAVSSLEETGETGKEMLGQLEEAMDDLQDDLTDFTDNMEKISDAADLLQSSIGDDAAADRALEELTDGLLDLGENVQQIGESIKSVSNAMGKLRQQIGESWEKLKEDLAQIGNAFMEAGKAAKQAAKSLKAARQNIKEGLNGALIAFSQIQSALRTISKEIDPEEVTDAVRELIEAVEDLFEEGEEADLDNVREAGDLGQETADELVETLEKVNTVVETLQDLGGEANDMIDEAYEIIADLAQQPAISFPNIDSSFIGHAHDLNSHLSSISDALGGLSSSIKDSSEILINDIQKLSDQFYVVIDLIIDEFLDDDEENTDLSHYQQDVSDEDTSSSTEGKVQKSYNVAAVQGDLNVGGIAGSMAIEYDFDPEDDVTKLGSSSLKFQYLSRAVLRECTNKGNITSKKDDAGSIVGRMDLGSVISCTGYGRIEGKDGSYIGGIAGNSNSHIKDCFAMCVLLGNSHVGGIAGYGSKLTDNYAMVDIERFTESAGAVAGEVESLENQSGNFFVERGTGGIDGISYSEKAAPISYEALSQVSNLPGEFTNLKITFKAEEETIAVIPFEFGSSIKEEDLPKVPEKEGYYGRWPKFDWNTLTFSTTLEAVYTPYRSVIAASLTEEGKAMALVEGNFDEETVLGIISADDAYPEKTDAHSKVWTVTLTTSMPAEKSYPLRLLCSSKEAASVYALQDNGSWRKLSSRRNGSYLIFDMEGSEGTFQIVYEKSQRTVFIIAGGVVAGMILLLVFLKKKKAGKNHSATLSGE